MRAFLLALTIVAAVTLLGCSDSSTGGTDSHDEGPCADVDCSGAGTCFSSGPDAICVCDPGYTPEGLSCVTIDPCGNGTLDPGEFCDPAAPDAIRPCSSVHLKFESGTAACEQDCSLNVSGCVTSSLCGNQTVEKGESCDDGNTVNGDGCSATCIDEMPSPTEESCGTDGDADMPKITPEHCSNPDYAATSAPEKIEQLRVRVHVAISPVDGVRADDGLDIDLLFAQTNVLLAPANISVAWDGVPRDVESPDGVDFFDFIRTEANQNAIFGMDTASDALDLYIVWTIKTIKDRALWGFAQGIGSSSLVITSSSAVTTGNLKTIAFTLAHELGHNFKLHHTHHDNDTVETDCATSGDKCCDTPLDPGPCWAWPKLDCDDPPEDLPWCDEVNCEVDEVECPNGDNCEVACPNGEEPPIHNVMSYYVCGYSPHQDNFTPCQATRARCYINKHLSFAMGGYESPVCGDGTCAPGEEESCPQDCCNCDGKECGDDGCGGSCGDCPNNGTCISGQCSCEPHCEGWILVQKDCTEINCNTFGGAQCGVNPPAPEPQCFKPCVPNCDGKGCGDSDGCGGACTACPNNGTCISGQCSCEPHCKEWILVQEDCTEINCNTFGGAQCGVNLPDPEPKCVQPCVPSCNGKVCGDDGCGGSCGDCPNNGTCISGQCSCEPHCKNWILVQKDCAEINCNTFGGAQCGVNPPDPEPQCFKP